MTFKLHLDADGKPQFDDKGTPLFMQDGASGPTPIDVNGLHDQIRAIGGEAATHRKEKEALEARLKVFDGLDPEAARKALETAKLLDDGKLLEAGKVDDIRQKAVAEFKDRLTNMENALEEAKTAGASAVQEKEQMIHNLLVKNAFSESAFLREKTVLPSEFAYASLGRHFTVEYRDGNPVVIAKDGQGNTLFSQANPGQNASPEEAIKILIEQHPQRDSLLKAPAPNGGSGAHPGDGRPAHGKLSPEEAGKLSPAEYSKARKDGRI